MLSLPVQQHSRPLDWRTRPFYVRFDANYCAQLSIGGEVRNSNQEAQPSLTNCALLAQASCG